MLFGDIIKSAGLNPANYPKLENIPINCLDRKGRQMEVDDLFPFFELNSNSKNQFHFFLKGLDFRLFCSDQDVDPEKMEVRINYRTLVVLNPFDSPKVFPF